MDDGSGDDTHNETHPEDRDHPSEPEGNRREHIWDTAQQDAGADNREAAGINLGVFALFLLDKPVELGCLLLQRPLELGDDLFAARRLLP
jgi:hypothetical protein